MVESHNGQPTPNLTKVPLGPIAAELDLAITLFGSPSVLVSRMQMRPLRSRRGMWLLGLLTLRDGREVDRSWVAGTLWPDSTDEHALASLRTSIADLRRALGPESRRLSSPTFRTLRFDLDGAYVDVVRFDQAVASGCYEEAIRLYGGQVLEGCSDEWALEARERRERSYLEALSMLTREAQGAGNYARAVELLRMSAAADPLRESLQAELLDSLTKSGDYAAAVETYRTFRNRTRADLNVDPGPEVAAAYRNARERAAYKPARHSTSQVSPIRVSQSFRPRAIPLIGRELEMSNIGDWLGSCSLLTLVGPGGIGKTSLALAAMERYEPAFRNCAAFVSLDPATDATSMVRIICDTLGVSDCKESYTEESICRYVADLSLLLVLDTCDQLISEAARIAARMIDSSPGLRIIATSRQPLNLGREFILRVGPLDLPVELPHNAANLPAIEDCSAVKLFVERGRAVCPDFKLDAENEGDIARICIGLDGLPLSIELAAARLNILGPTQIAERLNSTLSLLTCAKRDRPRRQQTLRDTLDWSCELLNPVERTLLWRLSVFNGTFDIEDIEAVCAGGAVSIHDVLPAIAGLADKSMLCVSEYDGRAIYRLLGVIREYAASIMSEPEEEDATRLALAERCCVILGAAAASRITLGDTAWRSVIRSKYPDLRASIIWAFASTIESTGSEQRISVGLKLTSQLCTYWAASGMVTEAIHHVKRALELCQNDLRMRESLLSSAAHFLVMQGDIEEANQYARSALRLCESSGLTPDVRGLSSIAEALFAAGDHNLARRMLSDALEVARSANSTGVVASVLTNMGVHALRQGDLESARRYHAESLGVSRMRQAQGGVAWSLDNLGDVAVASGEPQVALRYYLEALDAFHAIERPQGIAACINGISAAAAMVTRCASETQVIEDVAALQFAAMAVYAEFGIEPEVSEARIVAAAVSPLYTKLSDIQLSDAANCGREMTIEQAVDAARLLAYRCVSSFVGEQERPLESSPL